MCRAPLQIHSAWPDLDPPKHQLDLHSGDADVRGLSSFIIRLPQRKANAIRSAWRLASGVTVPCHRAAHLRDVYHGAEVGVEAAQRAAAP